MAGNGDTTTKPNDPEKAISAAYLRSIGFTQEQAAKAAGVGERTLARWEKQKWWGDICREAHSRWLAGITCKARGGILKALDDTKEYASMAKFVVERTIPELVPPKIRQEITGDLEVKDARSEVTSLLNRIASRAQTASDDSGNERSGG